MVGAGTRAVGEFCLDPPRQRTQPAVAPPQRLFSARHEPVGGQRTGRKRRGQRAGDALGVGLHAGTLSGTAVVGVKHTAGRSTSLVWREERCTGGHCPSRDECRTLQRTLG